MTYRRRLLPEAEDDIDLVSAYYEEERRGLGARFVLAAFDAIDECANLPKKHAFLHDPIRVARLDRFPFGVLFVLDGSEMVVLAVQDLRRSPRRRVEEALRRLGGVDD